MLNFEGVCLRVQDKTILENISFSLRPHRLTALVGRNGSGKTTLLRCVNQELPYTGSICDGEKNLALLPSKERAKHIAYLPQSLPAPHILAKEMVSFGRSAHLDFTGRLHDVDERIVEQALRDAGADMLAERYVDSLSGGERQRAALAMILAQNTPIALLDEPTAHMDAVHEAAFLRHLQMLKTTRKKTFLVVMHDLSAACTYADDILVLDAGKLVFSGTKEQFLHEQIPERVFGFRRYTFDDGSVFFAAK